MVRRQSIALSMVSAFLSLQDVALAFSPTSPKPSTHASKTHSFAAELHMTSAFFADATESKTPEAKVQVDANGKSFSVGIAVAIAPNRSVKAYQVIKSSYGSFDPATREFVPRDETNVTRGTSCLVLAEGLRGEVKKIYNTNEWDRTHPILVKFKAGEDREGEGGFNIPKTFQMHLNANEIIVVDY